MRAFCWSLIVLGLIVSGYLLSLYFSLVSGADSAGPSVCSTIFQADCDAALQSPISKQLGLPLPGWGIVFYGTLATVMLLSWLGGETCQHEAALLALVISFAGAVLSIALFLVILLGWSPFCPLCVVIHVVNLALVPAFKRMTGCSTRELLAALLAGGSLLLKEDIGGDARTQLKVSGLFSILLVGIVLYQWVFIQEKLHPPVEFDVRHAVASFAIRGRTVIPSSEEDPMIGADDAPHRIVVFTDLQCPGCRRFAAELVQLVESSDGELSAVFKHFPLSTACNPASEKDRHPRACKAAYAAEAAKLQGKFWEFHDAVFASNLNSEEVTFQQIARQAGLDVARFESDLGREEVVAKVKADIELGLRLSVDETPTVFLNGRRAPDIRSETLQYLLLSEQANKQNVTLD